MKCKLLAGSRIRIKENYRWRLTPASKEFPQPLKKTFGDPDIKLDRIPAYPILGAHNAQLIGASIREFLQDSKIFVKAQVASYERYRPDIIVMERDLLMDAEAMGNELKFPEDSMCISTRVALEDKGNLSKLQPADPAKDGRIPDYLESRAETKKIITDAIVSAVIAGPWTIAIGSGTQGNCYGMP